MELLFGPEIPARLVRQIQQANQSIVLISPYFDPWHHLTMAIRNAITVRGVKVILILRGGRDRAQQEAKARAFSDMGVTVKFVERLHAKLYLCDSVAFLTSLNLLRSSMEGSYELASIICQRTDPRAFKQLLGIVKEVADLTKADDLLAGSTTPRAPTKQLQKHTSKKSAGFCLRCKTAIPFNHTAPYCKSCYKSWSRWKNINYTEKHCHRCGKEASTSLNKPMCKTCSKKR